MSQTAPYLSPNNTATAVAQSHNRNKSIDYLRGIMATGVMYYHYSTYVSHDLSSDAIVSRLGVYCVAVFYILSGLTLYLVYKDTLTLSVKSLIDFSVKRIFRIFPLLWLVMTATILAKNISFNFNKFILNFSGLFGFVNSNALFSPVQWSIGNELVFYAFFPVMIFLIRFRPVLYWVFTIITVLVGGYFAFFVLKPESSFIQQWNIYTNPLNQIMLFNFGVIIGLSSKWVEHKKRTFVSLILALGLIGLLFYPTSGSKIGLVTGLNRFLFSIFCVMICFGAYFQKIAFPKYFERIFSFLGEASYSVYLLHPLVWIIVTKLNLGEIENSPIYKTTLCVSVTLFVSFLLYNWFELVFINLGRRFLKSIR